MNTSAASRIYAFQNRVLALLRGLDTGFYLGGGTAASRGYLNHRLSEDLELYVNDDPRFALWVEQCQVRLWQEKAWQGQVLVQEERYFSVLLSLAEMQLKVQFFNDGPLHAGKISEHELLGRLDSPENILASKVAALAARQDPNDLADVWAFCTRMGISLRAVLTLPESKAAGLFAPDLARILCTASPAEWNIIRWLQPPPLETYLTQLNQLGEYILLPRTGKTSQVAAAPAAHASAQAPAPAPARPANPPLSTPAAPPISHTQPAQAGPPPIVHLTAPPATFSAAPVGQSAQQPIPAPLPAPAKPTPVVQSAPPPVPAAPVVTLTASRPVSGAPLPAAPEPPTWIRQPAPDAPLEPQPANGPKRTGMLNLAAAIKSGEPLPAQPPAEPLLPVRPLIEEPQQPEPPRQTGPLSEMLHRIAAAEAASKNRPSLSAATQPPASQTQRRTEAPPSPAASIFNETHHRAAALPPQPPPPPPPQVLGNRPRQTGPISEVMQRITAAAEADIKNRAVQLSRTPTDPLTPPDPQQPAEQPLSQSEVLKAMLQRSGRATSELRSRFRRRVSYYVPIHLANEDDKVFGHLADISEKGLRVDCKYSVLPGDILAFRLDLPPDLSRKPSLIFNVICRWCKNDDMEPALYNAGFEVVKISADDRVIYQRLVENYSNRPSLW